MTTNITPARKRKTAEEQLNDIDQQLAKLEEKKRKAKAKLVAAQRRADTAQKVQLGVALGAYIQMLMTHQNYSVQQVMEFMKKITDTYVKPLSKTDRANLGAAVSAAVKAAQAQIQAATQAAQEVQNAQ